MALQPKDVLLTTVYKKRGDVYDYWGENISRKLRFSYPKYSSYGLRFLKRNILELNILEYPSISDFIIELEKGYEVVGFSLFTHEVPEILEMAKIARDKGIKTLWAGHYGALTYGMEDHFDKIFVGYGERELGEVFDIEIDKVKHPIIVDVVGLPFGVRTFPLGVLFTSRGCSIGCDFCQTPYFCDTPHPVPVESIDDILRKYKSMGVSEILIQDENFGLQKKHTDKVIELLERHHMSWYAMTRIDILNKNLDRWLEKGFSGALLGVESLRQDNLNKMGKELNVDDTISLLEKLEEVSAFVIGYYMIGFEDDTEESIKESIRRLTDFSIDMLQLCILTPFPRTKLWDRIDEEYGIFEEDWSKWDTKNLVWNHPNISPKKMRELLKWGFREAYPHKRFIQTPSKFYKMHSRRKGRVRAHLDMFSNFLKANIIFRKIMPPE